MSYITTLDDSPQTLAYAEMEEVLDTPATVVYFSTYFLVG